DRRLRRGDGRLLADAVHVRLQRELLRPRTPVPAAEPLHDPWSIRQPAGQRPAAHDPERQTRPRGLRAGRRAVRCADGHGHGDRLRPARRTGRDGWRHALVADRQQHDARQLRDRSVQLADCSGGRQGDPMTEFLNSLKADLLDRRLLPLLALVGALLVAAVAYAVLAGGSSSSRPTGPAPKSAVPAGISVTESNANPAESVAETTSGASVQRHGFAHDPFA